jgi:hypothetical protein
MNHNTFKPFFYKFSTVILAFLVLNISINFVGKVNNSEINKVETILELLALSVNNYGAVSNEFSENNQPPTEEIYHEITWFCSESTLFLFVQNNTIFSVIKKVNFPAKIYQEILLPPPLF